MHLSLSVFVWFAAKDKKKSVLYALAIVLHTAFDALTGYLGLKGMGTLLLEAMIGIGAFFCAAAAKKCWKKNHSKAQAEIQACGR